MNMVFSFQLRNKIFEYIFFVYPMFNVSFHWLKQTERAKISDNLVRSCQDYWQASVQSLEDWLHDIWKVQIKNSLLTEQPNLTLK